MTSSQEARHTARMTVKAHKALLDDLLRTFEAQPAASGYIDVIVSRANWRPLATTLLQHGFLIEAISWWEHVPTPSQITYGTGGPLSQYTTGLFAEVETFDPLPTDEPAPVALQRLIDTIESKRFTHPSSNTPLTYRDTPSLTPALWIVTEDDWEHLPTQR